MEALGGGAADAFKRMMERLATADAEPRTVMIDATCLKAYRTESNLRKQGDLGRLIRGIEGGLNTKLNAFADANGRTLSFFRTAGQVSDHTGAAALLDDLPEAQRLLGDRGSDPDWFRDTLHANGIQPCIAGRGSRNEPII